MSTEAISLLSSLPAMIERYELKYVIPFDLVDPICRFLEPYCAFDRHSMAHADRFYPVNSLYFDTPNFRFLEQRRWGADHRFNMRVRSYADGREGPYFAEIKYKTPTCVKKFRTQLEAAEWPHFLRSAPASSGYGFDADPESVSRTLFLRLADSYAIEPKIFTCYRRRAFLSRIDDYARVTFDIDMRYRPQDPMNTGDPYSLSPNDLCINYDMETIYDHEANHGANVVLELKATAGAIPLWMIDLIRRFELKQVGFSKYMNSSLVEHGDNGWRYMAADRAPAALLH